MIDPAAVSAVLVTRGDVPHLIAEITATINQAGIDDIVVWDNSERPEDVQCYGRFLGALEAKNDVIYLQDDDLLAPVADILRSYDPVRDAGSIVANNRIDEEWPLIGIGAVFHRDLLSVFDTYLARFPKDTEFYRTCDIPFGYLNSYRRIVAGYEDLPNASAPNSMYLQELHMEGRETARRRTFEL